MKWLVKLNPARVYAVVAAVFTLLTALGISVITDDIKNAIFGLLAALFTLVAGEVTRNSVTPNAKVLVYADGVEGYYPEIKAGEASVEATNANATKILAAAYTGRHRAEP